jgi:hypothetical protein
VGGGGGGGGGPPAASPEPGPSTSAAPQSTPEESRPRSADLRLHWVQKRHAGLVKARKHLKIVERRWKKTKQTYESGKHSYWAATSVVQRNQVRMLEIDEELGKARALVGHWNNGYRRARSYYMFRQRLQQNPTQENMKLALFLADRCYDWHERAVPHWKTAWPGFGHNIYDRIADQYGLAVTWGLMHASDLIEPEDPERDARRDALREARAAAWDAETRIRLEFLRSPEGQLFSGRTPDLFSSKYESFKLALNAFRAQRGLPPALNN